MQFRMSNVEIKDFSVVYFEGITAELLLRTGIASYPGSWWAERKEPGIYCSRMRVIISC